MLIIPSYFEFFNKNVTVSFFSLRFFHFICYIFILQLIFFQNALLEESPEEIFFMDIEKPCTFFMVKKDIKSNHNNFFVV